MSVSFVQPPLYHLKGGAGALWIAAAVADIVLVCFPFWSRDSSCLITVGYYLLVNMMVTQGATKFIQLGRTTCEGAMILFPPLIIL